MIQCARVLFVILAELNHHWLSYAICFWRQLLVRWTPNCAGGVTNCCNGCQHHQCLNWKLIHFDLHPIFTIFRVCLLWTATAGMSTRKITFQVGSLHHVICCYCFPQTGLPWIIPTTSKRQCQTIAWLSWPSTHPWHLWLIYGITLVTGFLFILHFLN